MPMFDDPKKELKRLENELLAEEEDDELDGVEELLKDYEEETLIEDCFSEEAEEDDTFSRPLERQVLGDDYSRTMSELLQEDDEDFDTDVSRKGSKKTKKKNNSVVGLAILCVLETAAIVGLLAWWYLCLR